ncbi:MAG: hypothetical protein KR126chlam5_00551 [Candidatus Anoxychlamydiales bacterium]|nr:hypothetical protein [Candidatus Anoxychlamydiales bacterium]NGX52255.1 hypothetical protein [Candidatus Anoxychlamydiales bacterium]
MKYLILDSQINFFQENGFIEFENIFPQEKIQIIENEIDTIFKSKKNLDFFKQYIAFRDLFRKSSIIKKITLDKSIASIAKTLSNRSSLRLLFDQTFITNKKNLFESFKTINDVISFQGAVCYAVIKLDSNTTIDSNNLPKKQGSLTFFKSSLAENHMPLNLKDLYSNSHKFLLIAYGDIRTLYKLNKNDPNLNYLKNFGYSFGDKLKDEFHPVVF